MRRRGKNVLAKALSKSLDCDFRRIRSHPICFPATLSVPASSCRSRGFSSFVQALVYEHPVRRRNQPHDSRTQSALLEAMSEGQASVDGKTHPLMSPFFVVATQNPYEFEGTYPLPRINSTAS